MSGARGKLPAATYLHTGRIEECCAATVPVVSARARTQGLESGGSVVRSFVSTRPDNDHSSGHTETENNASGHTRVDGDLVLLLFVCGVFVRVG